MQTIILHLLQYGLKRTMFIHLEGYNYFIIPLGMEYVNIYLFTIALNNNMWVIVLSTGKKRWNQWLVAVQLAFRQGLAFDLC